MKKYSWKSHGFSANAQKIGKELEKLEILGELNSEAVLKYAESHKNSELYKCFEWSDTEASKRYRLYQASLILSSISLEIKEEPKIKQRVYVSVKSTETGERTFKNIKEVLKNDDEYQQLISRAKLEFDNCKERYQSVIKKEDLKDIIFEIYREI